MDSVDDEKFAREMRCEIESIITRNDIYFAAAAKFSLPDGVSAGFQAMRQHLEAALEAASPASFQAMQQHLKAVVEAARELEGE